MPLYALILPLDSGWVPTWAKLAIYISRAHTRPRAEITDVISLSSLSTGKRTMVGVCSYVLMVSVLMRGSSECCGTATLSVLTLITCIKIKVMFNIVGRTAKNYQEHNPSDKRGIYISRIILS